MLNTMNVGTFKSNAIGACTISGTLSVTAAAPQPTSSTRTVTVPAGNSGTLDVVFNSGVSGSVQWRKNAGTWDDVQITTQKTFANGDSIQVRGTGMAALDTSSIDVKDNFTGNTIEAGILIQAT